jgi:hypothetical protein
MNKAENTMNPILTETGSEDSGWAESHPAGEETSACDSLAALD